MLVQLLEIGSNRVTWEQEIDDAYFPLQRADEELPLLSELQGVSPSAHGYDAKFELLREIDILQNRHPADERLKELRCKIDDLQEASGLCFWFTLA